jgi:SAM-dependent methyltransferase
MSSTPPEDTAFSPTIDRFSGFAATYDAARPLPPAILLELLPQLAQQPVPALVVDLGCGTGLSTRLWAATARQVIGIDPTPDMRAEAARQTTAPGVSYRAGFGHATGLPAGCADIVTCSQALHWMDPQPTFQEAARILRPGGVFAAYDYDWPPSTPHWAAEAAYAALQQRVAALEREHGASAGLLRWPKDGHLDRMRASGRFRFTRELLVHHRETGTADRFLRLVLSQGSVATLRKRGMPDAAIGLDSFAASIQAALGAGEGPWFFSYRVRIGVV